MNELSSVDTSIPSTWWANSDHVAMGFAASKVANNKRQVLFMPLSVAMNRQEHIKAVRIEGAVKAKLASMLLVHSIKEDDNSQCAAG